MSCVYLQYRDFLVGLFVNKLFMHLCVRGIFNCLIRTYRKRLVFSDQKMERIMFFAATLSLNPTNVRTTR